MMSNQPQLDPFAVESTAKNLYDQYGKGNWGAEWEHLHPRIRVEYIDKVVELVSGYFAAALPGSPSGRWTVSMLRTHFEWGGQVRLDPAEFDRVLANVRAEAKAEALEEAARGIKHMTLDDNPRDWLLDRVGEIRKGTRIE